MMTWIFIASFFFFILFHAGYKYQFKQQEEINLPGYSTLDQNDDEQDEDLQVLLKGGQDMGKSLHQRIVGDRMIDRQS